MRRLLCVLFALALPACSGDGGTGAAPDSGGDTAESASDTHEFLDTGTDTRREVDDTTTADVDPYQTEACREIMCDFETRLDEETSHETDTRCSDVNARGRYDWSNWCFSVGNPDWSDRCINQYLDRCEVSDAG